jgi:O-methyltransferase
MPDAGMHAVSSVLNYLTVGKYLALHEPERFADRFALFDHVAAPLREKRVLYLEFGVASGSALKHWVELLSNDKTQFHGFDSFEGLPVDWIVGRPAGHFSQEGKPPEIGDPRVRFHVGWFSETLPKFLWPRDYDQLVVNFDADLYESTRDALELVEPHVKSGDLFYFDEFNHRDHELRAFDEYLKRTGANAQAIAATHDLAKVAFRID